MSRLTYNGDTTMLFGAALPTPRIDSVKIQSIDESELEALQSRVYQHIGDTRFGESGPDGSTLPVYDIQSSAGAVRVDGEYTDPWYITTDADVIGNKSGFKLAKNWNRLDIDISFLFNSSDTFEPTKLIQELFDYRPDGTIEGQPPLWLNVIFIRDKDKIQKMKASKNYLADVREMVLNYQQNRADKFYDNLAHGPETEERFGQGLDSISGPSAIPGVYVVSVNNQPMSDLYTSIDVTPYTDDNNNMIYKVSGIQVQLYVRSMEFMADSSIFVATSTEDLQSMQSFSKPMLAMNFSDVTYEDYTRDGRLAAFGDPVYEDVNGIPCISKPIRALDGKYYKTEEYSAEQIYTELEDLVRPYLQYQSTDRDVRLCVEAVITTGNKYKNSVLLLEKLNALERFWPGNREDASEKSYELLQSYLIKLNNFNALLRDQGEVFKKIHRNFKFLDLRIRPGVDATPSGWDTIGSAGEIELAPLTSADYIPPFIFHSNMAKFQPIASATHSSMQAEIPINSEERDAAFQAAIEGKLFEISQIVSSVFNGFDAYMDNPSNSNEQGIAAGGNTIEAITKDMSQYMWEVSNYFVRSNGVAKFYANKYTKGDLNNEGASAFGGCGKKCYARNIKRLTQFQLWSSPVIGGRGMFELVVPRLQALEWYENTRGDRYDDLGVAETVPGNVNDGGFAVPGSMDASSLPSANIVYSLTDVDPFTTGYLKDSEQFTAFIKITRGMENENDYQQKFKNAIAEYMGTNSANFANEVADGSTTSRNPLNTSTTQLDPAGNVTFNEVVKMQIDKIGANLQQVLNNKMEYIQEQADRILSETAAAADITSTSLRDEIATDIFTGLYGAASNDPVWELARSTPGTRGATRNKFGGTIKNYLDRLVNENPFNFYIRATPKSRVDFHVHADTLTPSLVFAGLDFEGSGANNNQIPTPIYKHALALVSGYDDYLDAVREASVQATYEGDEAVSVGESSMHGKPVPPMIKQWNFGTVIAEAVATAFIDARGALYTAIRDLVDLAAENALLRIDAGLFEALSNVDILVKKGGYFFYDLEKYIRKKSFMSRFVNVDYMLQAIPNAYEMTNLGVGITEVKVQVTPDTDVSQVLGQSGVGIESMAFPSVEGEDNYVASSMVDNDGGVGTGYEVRGFGSEVDSNISMELKLSNVVPSSAYLFERASFVTQRKTLAVDPGTPFSETGDTPIDVDIQYYGYCSPYAGIATFNDLFISDNELTYLKTVMPGLTVDGEEPSAADLTSRILSGYTGPQAARFASYLFSPLVGLESKGEYSMLLPRAYNFTQFDNRSLPGNMTWRGNYRLAMFQYQYFLDDDDAYAWNYLPWEGGRPPDDKVIDPMTYTVNIRDHSFYVLAALYDEYILAYEDFYTNYYLKAHEYCAYDDFSGNFNDYFVEGIVAEYRDPIDQPWTRMATTFVYYLDFMTNFYGGNKALMTESAENILSTIRPETGNLEALDDFELEVRQFKEYFELQRENAVTMFMTETGLERAKIEEYLTNQSPHETLEIEGMYISTARPITHITTMYDHVGNYSTLSTGGEHSDTLEADPDRDYVSESQ